MKEAGDVSRYLRNTVRGWFSTWAYLGPIIVLIPQLKPEGLEGGFIALGFFLAIATGWGAWRGRKKRTIKVTIPGTDAGIVVKVGDLFKIEGVKFIPVNEYFDRKIGTTVAETSLHGQFIKRVMSYNEEVWQEQVVEKGLRGIQPREHSVTRKGGEARDRYPIGTCAHVTLGAKEEYVLIALSRTDKESLKAKAGLTDLFACIMEICRKGRERSEGRDVVIPLLGTGLSNTGMPAQEILDLLILLIRHESQKEGIAKRVTIVVGNATMNDVDLNETERRWKK